MLSAAAPRFGCARATLFLGAWTGQNLFRVGRRPIWPTGHVPPPVSGRKDALRAPLRPHRDHQTPVTHPATSPAVYDHVRVYRACSRRRLVRS